MTRVWAILCVAGGAAALPAQPPELQERIDAWIEQLGRDDGAWEAVQRLERLGGLALDSLARAALEQAAYMQDARRKKNALYVLGRLGRQAVPALPALLDVYRLEERGEFWRQALWAISEVAPFAGEDLRQAARRQVEGSRSRLPDIRTAVQRMEWGPMPPPEEVEAALASPDPALVLAAARTVACGMVPVEPGLKGGLAAALRQAWPDQDRNPWDPLPQTYPILGDLARAVLAAGIADATSRENALAALLWVEDPLERARAVAALGALEELKEHSVLQLVARLRDPDDAVRLQVVKLLARRSAQAAVHPFQQLAAEDGSEAGRGACRAALAALDLAEPEDEAARRARVRARLQGAVWFGGPAKAIARQLARLGELGGEEDARLALRLVAILEEPEARAALAAVGALAAPRLLADGELEQRLATALWHRGDRAVLLPDAVRCVARAWTRGDAPRSRLLEACGHPLLAVRFAAVIALAERADGAGVPAVREALLGCHRGLPSAVRWSGAPVSPWWFEVANEGVPLLEIAAVAARVLVGAPPEEQAELLERLARYRDEEPAATRSWAGDRPAVLEWMRELEAQVGQ